MVVRLVLACLTALWFIPADAETAFEYLGASTAALDNPHDLKLTPNGKYLLVADVGNDRVALLDPASLALVASFGTAELSGPHDLDFDSQGRVYVADTHNNRVAIFTLAGTAANLTGELSGRIRGPEGVLVHPNGRVYVAGAWSGNVVAYEGGRVVAELGGLSSPHDLELAPGGGIWLADAGNDRMLLLSPALAVKREWQGPPFDFAGVRYLDVLPDGAVIAADKNNHAVKLISGAGRLLAVIGAPGRPGKGPGLLRTPEGVEVRGDTLWVSDSGNDRVVKYRIGGN